MCLFKVSQWSFLLNRTRPVIGALQNGELGGWIGVTNFPQLNFDEKECEVFGGMFVEILDGGTMFFASVFNNPHEDCNVSTCGVGEEFAEVIVVGASVLVFDENDTRATVFLGDNVRRELANGDFCASITKLNLKSFPEDGEVFVLRKPFGKLRFFRPSFPNVYTLEGSQFHLLVAVAKA